MDSAVAGTQNQVKVEKFMLSQGKTDHLKDTLGFLNQEQRSWDMKNSTAVRMPHTFGFLFRRVWASE